MLQYDSYIINTNFRYRYMNKVEIIFDNAGIVNTLPVHYPNKRVLRDLQ